MGQNIVEIVGGLIQPLFNVEEELCISQLPEEIVDQVLFFLDVRTLIGMREICKKFANKIQYKMVAETTKQLNPIRDNQNELYYSETLELPDTVNVIGFHFSVASHDQGWSSVDGSYTWGEMAFMDNELNKEVTNRVRIFTGKPAKRNFKKYKKFVHRGEIKEFDKLPQCPKIGIWARSCYTGWQCYIGGARISIVFLNSE